MEIFLETEIFSFMLICFSDRAQFKVHPTPLLHSGLVTFHTTVKWSLVRMRVLTLDAAFAVEAGVAAVAAIFRASGGRPLHTVSGVLARLLFAGIT